MTHYQKVRSRLIDEQSRIIYDSRISFSMTGEQRQIWHMLEQIDGLSGVARLKKLLVRNSHKKLMIFGAGYNGIFLLKCLNEFSWHAFLDNKVETVSEVPIINAQISPLFNESCSDIPIYNPQYYIEKNGVKDTLFIISVPGFSAQLSISNQLLSLGVKESDIFAFAPSNTLIPQYFDVFSPVKNEIFVDCGALDGETTYDFARWCRGNYDKAFVFEADKDNYEKCQANLNKLKDVIAYNLGVWDGEELLRFNKTSTGFSNILEDQNSFMSNEKFNNDIVEIKTCALDGILLDEAITFIKMDIEGAELNALKGASRIILKNKPKLAICVYHKPEDIWEIPNLLLSIRSDYYFQLRHYGLSGYETVLYAQ